MCCKRSRNCTVGVDIYTEPMRATQNLGVDIDKEELIKALKYDRNQYQKDFNDAKQQLERHAHWLYRSTNRFYECSYCGNITYSSEDKYCSNCGCGMDKVKECK